MLQIMLMPLRRYADFRGRAGREEFWLFMLFNYIVAMVFASALGIIMLLLYAMDVSESEMLTVCYLLVVPWGLWSLYLVIPALAVTVRRLHDVDKSGWHILLGLIPVIGTIFLLLWYATRGTPGANRWGAPSGDDAAQAFA
jgi:uncharacterized membrane protein YhaH (DUF805 family)